MEIKIIKNVMLANQKVADRNRSEFEKRNILAVNIMASPGAGKTSFIKRLITAMRDTVNFFVVEGDIASSIDAQKLESMGIPVVQINTGGGCHLDANMISKVLEECTIPDNSILIIENVGNLVCPSSFDLGENLKLVIASVSEGDDKPYKYISMFECADMIVLNKMDMIDFVEFDKDFFLTGIKAVNENAPVFEVSCRTGEGMNSVHKFFTNKLVK